MSWYELGCLVNNLTAENEYKKEQPNMCASLLKQLTILISTVNIEIAHVQFPIDFSPRFVSL